MMEILYCGFIAQWCSELAPFSLKGAIYSQRRARAAGEVTTLIPCDNGTCGLCIIKGDDIILPYSRRLCRLRINNA
jgi:hypothetical protein